ncbi:NTP transferase domain-containing protein [Caulobacter segnis]
MAAGVGSRLGGAEDGVPKGLLEVGNVCLLERQVEQLRAQGVGRICIVTGYRPETHRAALRRPRRVSTQPVL